MDFGDLPHSFAGGGAPQASAVVCWGRDRAVVVGRLFYDSQLAGLEYALVDLRGFSGADQLARVWMVARAPGAVRNIQVREVWLLEPGRLVDRIHIQLALTPPTGGNRTVVHDSDHVRGD